MKKRNLTACALVLSLHLSAIGPSDPASERLIREHTDAILAKAGVSQVSIEIDATLPSPESFHTEATADGIRLRAGGAAGAFYGALELVLPHSVVEAEGTPDFELRGAVLMMLSASWGYQSELSPDRYPWFYDQDLLTRYLDYLASARINTLIIWSGHLFPHILELPEYPDASRFSAEEIRRNQEQFRWLSTECAKRNITILTHFYNIHISSDLAESLGREGYEPSRYEVPDAFVTEYYRTILSRYYETFPGVGLYICPGESLALEHQEPWFRDVIFATATESGRNPPLVIRDWTLDPEFQAKLPTMYPNLYSELKHNDETITSPWHDERHEIWAGVLKGHIINLHDPADATPYRVGSPRLLSEMVRHWADAGIFMGSWWYPPQSWTWPHTLDRVIDADGEESALNTFERDPLWHLLEGRLLWKSDHTDAANDAWATAWMGRRFGSHPVGAEIVDWYDLTAPILPGLQNLTAVRFGNFFPPSIARVQADIDEIIGARTSLDEGPIEGATGLTNQRYYSRPVDAYTLDRYRTWTRTGVLRDLRSLPVTQYAAMLEAGEPTDGYVRPDALLEVYAQMAQESLAAAERARMLPSTDPDELDRFVQDSRIFVDTVEFYRHKVLAALAKRRFELSGNRAHLQTFRAHLDASVPAYEQMFRYASQFYSAGSAMWDAKPWARTFEDTIQVDYQKQLNWLATVEGKGE